MSFDKAIQRHIQIMNIAFEESEKSEDVYTEDFKELFKKSGKHIERLIRIREQAMGRK